MRFDHSKIIFIKSLNLKGWMFLHVISTVCIKYEFKWIMYICMLHFLVAYVIVVHYLSPGFDADWVVCHERQENGPQIRHHLLSALSQLYTQHRDAPGSQSLLISLTLPQAADHSIRHCHLPVDGTKLFYCYGYVTMMLYDFYMMYTLKQSTFHQWPI